MILRYFQLKKSFFFFKEPAVRDTLVNMANALRGQSKGSLVRIATGLRIVSAKNRAVFGRFPSIHTRPCASQCQMSLSRVAQSICSTMYTQVVWWNQIADLVKLDSNVRMLGKFDLYCITTNRIKFCLRRRSYVPFDINNLE